MPITIRLGLQYDANGNQTWDAQGATAYGWNVENRLATETSQSWPARRPGMRMTRRGKRVMKDVNPEPERNGRPAPDTGMEPGSSTSMASTGQKLMTLDCNYADNGRWRLSLRKRADLYDGGLQPLLRQQAVQSNGSAVVTDRLGSVRYSAGVSRSLLPVRRRADVNAGGHGEIRHILQRRAGAGLRGAEILQQRVREEILECGPGGMKSAKAAGSDQFGIEMLIRGARGE